MDVLFIYLSIRECELNHFKGTWVVILFLTEPSVPFLFALYSIAISEAALRIKPVVAV